MVELYPALDEGTKMTKDRPLTIKIDDEEVRLWVDGKTFHRSPYRSSDHYERECQSTEEALDLCKASYLRGIELTGNHPK